MSQTTPPTATAAGASTNASTNTGAGATGTDATAREERLARWVRQPPAPPNVQYLRDAEREAALRLLGRDRRESVLDLASEARVTAGAAALADRLTRVDFSAGASERAREVVDAPVADFAVADPEAPALPFPDDSFDGVVSVGPYDWPFLAAGALTREVRRVLRPGGTFVYSVMTPRSPYARNGKAATYTARAAADLLGRGWRVTGRELVFQYPGPAHDAVGRLPPAAQRPLVALAGGATRALTAADARSATRAAAEDAAAYVVLAATPDDHATRLDGALDALFRPVAEAGFFDVDAGTITRALTYEFEDADGDGTGTPDGLRWGHDDAIEWRYAPFALLGVCRWRASVGAADDRHDDRLRATLDHFAAAVTDPETRASVPSYGLGPLCGAFALAGRAFDGVDAAAATRYLDAARRIHAHTRERVRFDHAEDALVVHGWTFLHDVDPTDALLADVAAGLDAILARRTEEGLFAFENATWRRHQNQMYVLWGLSRAIRATGRREHLHAVEAVLEHTIDRRMRADGAFVWEDLPLRRRLVDAVRERLSGDTAYWRYLYACHQTFFVNAVAHYYEAGGTRAFDDEVRRAMAWIHGANALGRDLVAVSGIGVPMRQLTTDGRMDARRFVGGRRDQQYKGTYEVGSYVAALTHLLDGTID